MREIAVRHARAITVAVLSFACLATLPREAAAQDATKFISDLGTQAIQVLGPSVPQAQRASRFRQLFQNDFDLQNIARFVLGPHGRAMPPQEQQEFINVFREFLVQSYTTRLAEYAGQPFHVTGSRPQDDGAIVSSQVMRKSGAPIEIDWHVINRDGRMLITDVVVDAVSMKVTQRNEFAAIIQRNGGRPEALVAALRQQLTQGAPALTGSSMPPKPSADTAGSSR